MLQHAGLWLRQSKAVRLPLLCPCLFSPGGTQSVQSTGNSAGETYTEYSPLQEGQGEKNMTEAWVGHTPNRPLGRGRENSPRSLKGKAICCFHTEETRKSASFLGAGLFVQQDLTSFCDSTENSISEKCDLCYVISQAHWLE